MPGSRTLLVVAALLLLLALAVPGSTLWRAHRQIRAVAPALPDVSELMASVAGEGGPIGVRFVNSASQKTGPDQTMGHPAFVLDWADGRRFLIDAGMEAEPARAFGRPLEWILAAEPAIAHGAVVDQLGPAARSVRGLAFTHLHIDHTQGVIALCRRLARALPLFQTPWQADELNHTTRMGLAHVEEAQAQPGAERCAAPTRLESRSSVYPIPGFPGLVAIAAGGHTPGTTLYLARVGSHHWLFSGDVTNTRAELDRDLPKPALYSLLVVPEAPDRLARLRRWLVELDRRRDLTVVVSHDQTALERTAIAAWPSAAGGLGAKR